MEEGQNAHDAFAAFLEFGAGEEDLLDVGGDVGVGEHGGFGDAGGAAGELEGGDVLVGVDLHRFGGFGAGGQRFEPDEGGVVRHGRQFLFFDDAE